jgi:hypothetical protein
MFKFSRLLFAAPFLSFSLFSQQPVSPAVALPTQAEPQLTPTTPLPTIAQGDIQYNEKKDPDAGDMDALRRWLRDKRMVTVKEIGGDLSLSGEIRTEFQDTSENRDGIRQRGKGSATSKAQYAWDIEVNVMIDYRTDRTWAAIKLEFDNNMGVRSGEVNKIRLEKGYLGGRIVAGDTLTIDGEIGRRYLGNVYESKVEFAALFDGAVFRFNKAFPSMGDYYFNAGAFLIDDRSSHYGYVSEMGGLRIANVGLNIKYSLIDWYKPYANQFNNLRFKYLVSQFLVSYQFYPEWIGKRLIKFYGAGLCNHLASGLPITHGERQNYGCYAGVSIGLVKKQGDWAIDANYQWVQAQTIPDFDVSGIGRGNASSIGLYTVKIDGNPDGGFTDVDNATGNCNYKGFEIEALYAFTNNFTLLQNFKFSNTLNKSIGPDIIYKQYEAEFIYAF